MAFMSTRAAKPGEGKDNGVILDTVEQAAQRDNRGPPSLLKPWRTSTHALRIGTTTHTTVPFQVTFPGQILYANPSGRKGKTVMQFQIPSEQVALASRQVLRKLRSTHKESYTSELAPSGHYLPHCVQ